MNDTDTTDDAAIQFLLTTEAGNDENKYDPETLAFSIIIGLKMWREAVRRMWNLHDEERLKATPRK